MIKKLFLFSVILIAGIGNALAKTEWHDNNQCLYSDHGNDHFYYCGNDYGNCGKRNFCCNDKAHAYSYAGNLTEFGLNLYCCPKEGKGKSSLDTEGGRFINSLANTEIITNSRPGIGECQYERITDVCGVITSDPGCTVSCPPGQIERNSLCATPCGAGKVFESATTNACIDCTTTLYQGVNSTGEYCVKCTQGTQFYNKATRTCVAKSSLAIVAADTMQFGKNSRTKESDNIMEQCWTKFAPDYAACVNQ